jgi:hypothetical protein
MVYHDAIREGVISCWPQDAEPPLRQSITLPRPSGTVTIPEMRPHHPGLGSNPTSSPCRRANPVEASSTSAPLPYPDVVTLNARQQSDRAAGVGVGRQIIAVQ